MGVTTGFSSQQAEALFRSAFEEAPVGMAVLDLDGAVVRANRALGWLLGRAPEALEGRDLWSAVSLPEDAPGDRAALELVRRDERVEFAVERRWRHAAGHHVWVEAGAVAVRDEDGTATHVLLQVQDVTDRRRYEAQLQHLADHDALTGLLNRRSFERAVERHLGRAGAQGPRGALLAIDLDGFKPVNDRLGHEAGDRLLVLVAQALANAAEDRAFVGRLGGDEFAALLAHGGADEALSLAERLRSAVRLVATGELSVTASVGVAVLDAAPEDLPTAMARADAAMYEAKRAGRDGVRVAGPPDPAARDAAGWEALLRTALAEDRLELHAQPVVAVSDGTVRHHELLLRLRDETGEVLPADRLLAAAGRAGLHAELDRWVVGRALSALAATDTTLEVNLSTTALRDPALLQLLELELAGGADGSRLVLEIGEADALLDAPRARTFAARLAALGVRFALDDFGAGLASLAALRTLPCDFLKLDGQVVARAATSEADRIVLAGVVGIARGLGRATIAEHVADEPTMQVLREIGVDLAQGYHVGRPAPLDQAL
jgi:diguanylate cyclase (GGDEF)-like protein/PAS domain S-box-containing protein